MATVTAGFRDILTINFIQVPGYLARTQDMSFIGVLALTIISTHPNARLATNIVLEKKKLMLEDHAKSYL